MEYHGLLIVLTVLASFPLISDAEGECSTKVKGGEDLILVVLLQQRCLVNEAFTELYGSGDAALQGVTGDEAARVNDICNGLSSIVSYGLKHDLLKGACTADPLYKVHVEVRLDR